MMVLGLILSFIFGAAIGSFLNVVTLRLPVDRSLDGRSHCPHCQKVLSWWELLPLVSFIILRGRCSSCGRGISIRYPLMELMTALLFTVCWLSIQPANIFGGLLLLKFWLAAACLLVVFVVDWEHYLILDGVIGFGAAVCLVLNIGLALAAGQGLWSPSNYWLSGILGALIIFALFFLLWYFSSGRALGFGDVKLAVFLGLLLGWPISGVSVFLAVMLGGVVSAFLLIFTRKTLKSQIPFGTFLSLSALFCLFYGPMIWHWYLALLGF